MSKKAIPHHLMLPELLFSSYTQLYSGPQFVFGRLRRIRLVATVGNII